MTLEKQVEEALPELQEIEDDGLRRKVIQIWVNAAEDNGYDDVNHIPFSTKEGLESESKIGHTQEVARVATAIVDAVRAQRDVEIDRDLVIAGALLHDVAKPYEVAGFGDWGITHPIYGVHLLADAGLSQHLQHIVLAHTPRTKVEPKTLEAELVRLADLVGAQTLVFHNMNELMDL